MHSPTHSLTHSLILLYFFFETKASKRSDGKIQLSHPIQSGILKDASDLEVLYSNIYKTLKVAPTEHPLLISDSIDETKPTREKIAQMCFETFDVPAYYVHKAPVLNAFASGRTTALSVNCGFQVSRTVAVYEGVAMPHATRRLHIGGEDLTQFMYRAMCDQDKLTTCDDARNAKESLCFVTMDYEKELKNVASSAEDFELPDGSSVTLDKDRVTVPEILFNPRILGSSAPGIHNDTFNTILNCENVGSLHDDLFENIVCSGGSVLFKGFGPRLQKELKSLGGGSVSKKANVHCATTDDQTFRGASFVSSLPSFVTCWVTKQEYKENGPSIVHRKCADF